MYSGTTRFRWPSFESPALAFNGNASTGRDAPLRRVPGEEVASRVPRRGVATNREPGSGIGELTRNFNSNNDSNEEEEEEEEKDYERYDYRLGRTYNRSVKMSVRSDAMADVNRIGRRVESTVGVEPREGKYGNGSSVESISGGQRGSSYNIVNSLGVRRMGSCPSGDEWREQAGSSDAESMLVKQITNGLYSIACSGIDNGSVSDPIPNSGSLHSTAILDEVKRTSHPGVSLPALLTQLSVKQNPESNTPDNVTTNSDNPSNDKCTTVNHSNRLFSNANIINRNSSDCSSKSDTPVNSASRNIIHRDTTSSVSSHTYDTPRNFTSNNGNPSDSSPSNGIPNYSSPSNGGLSDSSPSPNRRRRLYEPSNVINTRRMRTQDRFTMPRPSVQYTSGEEGLVRSLDALSGMLESLNHDDDNYGYDYDSAPLSDMHEVDDKPKVSILQLSTGKSEIDSFPNIITKSEMGDESEVDDTLKLKNTADSSKPLEYSDLKEIYGSVLDDYDDINDVHDVRRYQNIDSDDESRPDDFRLSAEFGYSRTPKSCEPVARYSPYLDEMSSAQRRDESSRGETSPEIGEAPKDASCEEMNTPKLNTHPLRHVIGDNGETATFAYLSSQEKVADVLRHENVHPSPGSAYLSTVPLRSGEQSEDEMSPTNMTGEVQSHKRVEEHPSRDIDNVTEFDGECRNSTRICEDRMTNCRNNKRENVHEEHNGGGGVDVKERELGINKERIEKGVKIEGKKIKNEEEDEEEKERELRYIKRENGNYSEKEKNQSKEISGKVYGAEREKSRVGENEHERLKEFTFDSTQSGINQTTASTSGLRMYRGVANVNSRPRVVAMSDSDSVFAYSATSQEFESVTFNLSPRSLDYAEESLIENKQNNSAEIISISSNDIHTNVEILKYPIQINKQPLLTHVQPITSYSNNIATNISNSKLNFNPQNSLDIIIQPEISPNKTIPIFSNNIGNYSPISIIYGNQQYSRDIIKQPWISPIQPIPLFVNTNDANSLISSINTSPQYSKEIINKPAISPLQTIPLFTKYQTKYPNNSSMDINPNPQEIIKQPLISPIQSIPPFVKNNDKHHSISLLNIDTQYHHEIIKQASISPLQSIPEFVKNNDKNTLIASLNIDTQNSKDIINTLAKSPLQLIPLFSQNKTKSNINSLINIDPNTKESIEHLLISSIQSVPSSINDSTENQHICPGNIKLQYLQDINKQPFLPYNQPMLSLHDNNIENHSIQSIIKNKNSENVEQLHRSSPLCKQVKTNDIVADESIIIPSVHIRNSSLQGNQFRSKLNDFTSDQYFNNNNSLSKENTPSDDQQITNHNITENDKKQHSQHFSKIKQSKTPISPLLISVPPQTKLTKSISFDEKIININTKHTMPLLNRSNTLPKPKLKLIIPVENKNVSLKAVNFTNEPNFQNKIKTPYPRKTSEHFETSSKMGNKSHSKRVQTPYPRDIKFFNSPNSPGINLSDRYDVEPMRKSSLGERCNSEITNERVSICTSPNLESLVEISNEEDISDQHILEYSRNNTETEHTLTYESDNNKIKYPINKSIENKYIDKLEVKLNEEFINRIRKLSVNSNEEKYKEITKRQLSLPIEGMSISHILPTIRRHNKNNPINRMTICSRQPKKRKENIFKRRNTMVSFDIDNAISVVKKHTDDKPKINKKRVSEIIDVFNNPNDNIGSNIGLRRQKSIIKSTEINKKIEELELRNKIQEKPENIPHKEVKFTNDASYLTVSTADALKTITDEFDFGSSSGSDDNSTDTMQIEYTPPTIQKIGKLLRSKSFMTSKPLFNKKNMASLRGAKEYSGKIQSSEKMNPSSPTFFGIFNKKDSYKSIKREKSLKKMRRKMSIGELLIAKANLKKPSFNKKLNKKSNNVDAESKLELSHDNLKYKMKYANEHIHDANLVIARDVNTKICSKELKHKCKENKKKKVSNITLTLL